MSLCPLFRFRALRRLTLSAALFALGSVLLSPVRADPLNVTFTVFNQSGNPGQTLNYSAAFENTTADTLTVSSATFTFTDPAFEASGSYGFFNGNGVGTGAFIVAAHSTLSVADVVSLVLDGSLPPNTYTSTVSFNYRAPGDTTDSTTGDSTITANVSPATAVPEPAFCQMAALLALGGLGWRRMHKREACTTRRSTREFL